MKKFRICAHIGRTLCEKAVQAKPCLPKKMVTLPFFLAGGIRKGVGMEEVASGGLEIGRFFRFPFLGALCNVRFIFA